MGSYIYGRTQQVRTFKNVEGGTIDINLAKYLFKPVNSFLGDDPTEARQNGLVTRYENAWEGKELPRFMIMADTFAAYDSHTVYDTSEAMGTRATFWDSGIIGKEIGPLKKIRGRWAFHPKSDRIRLPLPDSALYAEMDMEEIARILDPANRGNIPIWSEAKKNAEGFFKMSPAKSIDVVCYCSDRGDRISLVRFAPVSAPSLLWNFN